MIRSADQMPLFEPPSDWRPPTGSLPSLAGIDIALDLETRDGGLEREVGPGWVYDDGWICGVAVAWADEALYVPIRHPDTECRDQSEVLSWCAELLCRNRAVLHNAPYDLGWLRHTGLPWPEQFEDTQAMCIMADENWDSYSLDACCRRAGVPGKNEAALRNAADAYGVDPKSGLWRLPARHVGPYAEQDARATLALHEATRRSPRFLEIEAAYRLELRLMPVVHAMRERGIRIDIDRALQIQRTLRGQRDEALAEIARTTGRRATIHDVRSPDALGDILQRAGVEAPITPKTRKPSVRREWLERLEAPIGRLIREARRTDDLAEKFLGTYVLEGSHRGRVHAEIHQLRDEEGGTRSFRLSYSSPPLQQIPARTKEGAMIRQAFVSEQGTWWAAPDYCHDDQTEILTEHGWRLFSALDRTERVAQWHPDGSMSWVAPTDWYVGPPRLRRMVRARGPRQVDFLVTENHRCLVWDDRRGPLVTEARHLDQESRERRFVHAGTLVEGADLPLAAVRLAVACQADGADRGKSWRFFLKKQRKIDRLVSILTELGWPHRVRPGAKGDQTAVVFPDHPIARSLMTDGKRLSARSVLAMSLRCRAALCEEAPLWDGCGRGYYSTDEMSVDTVQAAAATVGRRAGKGASMPPDGRRPFFSVTMSAQNMTQRTRQTTVETVDYDGPVYCVTVPSGYIVTRRSGRVTVSGNSQQEPRLAVHFASVARIHGAEDAISYYRETPNASFHRMVEKMTGIDYNSAKIINLGLMYGMGIPKLAAALGVTIERATELVALYHERVPWVRGLSRECESLARRRGWIRLADGARCHFDLWVPQRDRDDPRRLEDVPRRLDAAREAWRDTQLVRANTHKAMNRLVQGSAARQTKLAMVECSRCGLLPMIQMHDEMGFAVSEEAEGERAAQIMREVMPLRVPVQVDLEYGRSWGQAKHSWEDRDAA